MALGVHTGSSLRTIRSMGIARLLWRRLRESICGTEERGLPVREACEARQESGPPEKSEDGAEMRYNDRGHQNTPSGRWGW